MFDYGKTHLLVKTTSKIPKTTTRSIDDEYTANYPREIERFLLNQKPVPSQKALSIEYLNVSVIHGDLKNASYPLMLGHYQSDVLVNAEATLDEYFNHRLSQRYELRRYPNKICESLVLFDPQNQPKGAIIIGLGEAAKLTAHELSESVKAGVIEYILFMNDNSDTIKDQSIRTGLSILFIGSTSDNISMENSISAILLGIALANTSISKMDENIPKIKHIEFIEKMDHIVEHGFQNLALIERNPARFKIDLEKKIESKSGRKKGSFYRQDDDFWCTMRTTKDDYDKGGEEFKKLEFTLSTGKSRIEKEYSYISDTIVNGLLEQLNENNSWDINTSKTLFELLIPNSFKEILRTQNNILWKMDQPAATIPWEMFHDMSIGTSSPTFVNAGLIRQFITEKYRDKPEIIRDNSALVIGITYEKSDLVALPQVKEESEQIIRDLEVNDFDVTPDLDGKWSPILEKVITKRYKILHISGHGKYDEETQEIGIALDDQIFLRPELLRQKTVVPEFAFINCCYSGYIPDPNSKYHKHRNRFAANIGTQLIDMGAEAVVVAGWAIYDSASSHFARNLYKFMMEGYTFGTAVLKARKACYEYEPNTNTWAAFQCYGNPWYKLVKKTPASQSLNQYISKAQLIQDLENLLFDSEDNYTSKETILHVLQESIDRAKEADMYDSDAIELVARIHHAIGDEEMAYATYDQLVHQEDATYSVKSMEQYCNLMGKVLVKRFKKDPASVSSEDINKLKKELGTLAGLHHTSERNSILASGYKRLAILDKPNHSDHLTEMTKYYKLAYQIAEKGTVLDSIYSLTNWGVGIALSLGTKGAKPSLYLKTLRTKRQEVAKQINKAKNFWQKIAPANIALTLILFESKSIELNTLKKTVLDTYKMQWKDAGNRGNLNAELQHIEFLLKFMKDGKARVIVEDIKAELVELGRY